MRTVKKAELTGDPLRFEYKGSIDYGTLLGNEIPIYLMLEAIYNIKYPELETLLDNVDIFIFPAKLMMKHKKYNILTGEAYQGRAYDTHIIYGNRDNKPTVKDISPLVIHELGHTLMYLCGKCNYANHMETQLMKDYIALRGIPSTYTPSSEWHQRPAEIFAEDFRYLFGDEDHKSESFSTFDVGNEPDERIKKFMIEMVQEYVAPSGYDESESANISEGEYADMSFKFPLKEIDKARITSKFGHRNDPISGERKMHAGIDIVTAGNDDIISCTDGVVVSTRYDKIGFGYRVTIEFKDKLNITYAHLKKPSHLLVGDKVKTGDVIGTMGSSGRSTGKHLHIELRDGYYPDHKSIDITKYLEIENKEGAIQMIKKEEIKPVIVEQKVSDWAKSYWDAFVSLGLIDGTNPQNQMTREQGVTIIGRALEKSGIIKKGDDNKWII